MVSPTLIISGDVTYVSSGDDVTVETMDGDNTSAVFYKTKKICGWKVNLSESVKR